VVNCPLWPATIPSSELEFKTVSVEGLGSGMGRALDKADAMLTLSSALYICLISGAIHHFTIYQ